MTLERLCAISLIVATAFNFSSEAHADPLFDLLKQGYRHVLTINYMSFDGCESDKAYALDSHTFVCSEYGYHYHYGEAMIVGKQALYQGKQLTLVQLCIKGNNECYRGTLYRK